MVPYGVYDLADDSGWVSVGITSDTAQFAVNAIRGWFEKMGRERYPAASRLLITAAWLERRPCAALEAPTPDAG